MTAFYIGWHTVEYLIPTQTGLSLFISTDAGQISNITAIAFNTKAYVWMHYSVFRYGLNFTWDRCVNHIHRGEIMYVGCNMLCCMLQQQICSKKIYTVQVHVYMYSISLVLYCWIFQMVEGEEWHKCGVALQSLNAFSSKSPICFQMSKTAWYFSLLHLFTPVYLLSSR